MPAQKGASREEIEITYDAVQNGKNHLFAIGINEYKDFTQLSNARKDIEDIAAILSTEYYFERQNIRLLCDNEATRGNIIDELDGLRRKIKAEDRLNCKKQNAKSKCVWQKMKRQK